jgi:hypothetical protein
MSASEAEPRHVAIGRSTGTSIQVGSPKRQTSNIHPWLIIALFPTFLQFTSHYLSPNFDYLNRQLLSTEHRPTNPIGVLDRFGFASLAVNDHNRYAFSEIF